MRVTAGVRNKTCGERVSGARMVRARVRVRVRVGVRIRVRVRISVRVRVKYVSAAPVTSTQPYRNAFGHGIGPGSQAGVDATRGFAYRAGPGLDIT